MNEDSPYSSYNLDHLGLIVGMVDELGLPELIDTVIKQGHEKRQVSVGLCVAYSGSKQPLVGGSKVFKSSKFAI